MRIYEFCPTMIHAKTLTIDGVWSSVGSVNFDNRSFQLQDEVTLCICSSEFAGRLDAQFERDLERSAEIEPGPLERPPAARPRRARRSSASPGASCSRS